MQQLVKDKIENTLRSDREATYVLITPTRNEEEHIVRTMDGIVAQNVRPLRWVIVSDGSTDRTDELVRTYAEKHDFIRLVRVEDRSNRDFASKVYAFRRGREELADLDYDFIGNLDADILLGKDYYAAMLEAFEKNESLGLAGGVRYDLCGDRFQKFDKASNSVGGCVQLYRRECFEKVGGFLPLPFGGEDAVAEIMTRMHGWKVKSFPRQKIFHYRETGAMNRHVLRTRFREGLKDYLIGYHPLFELCRCLFRLRQKRPLVLGALVSAFGFFWGMIQRMERPVPREMIRYLHREQLGRLFKRPR